MNGKPRAKASFGVLWAAVEALGPADYAAAADWWDEARRDIAALAAESGDEFERVVYAVAAASPGVPWRACLQNVRVLIAARDRGDDLPSGPGCGLEIASGRRHIAKAWAILRGADVSICRGPKVSAFAANLLGDLTAVTVDRHITRAATGADLRQPSPAEARRIATMVTTIGTAKNHPPAVIATALWMRAARVRATARP